MSTKATDKQKQADADAEAAEQQEQLTEAVDGATVDEKQPEQPKQAAPATHVDVIVRTDSPIDIVQSAGLIWSRTPTRISASHQSIAELRSCYLLDVTDVAV